MTDDRSCIRGCTTKDAHWAACPNARAGHDDPTVCRGCAPRPAADGALICEPCRRTIRRLLEDAGDAVGHLRSIADPTKARAFDGVVVQSSRPDLPAPVAADLITASDDVVRALRSWEYILGGDVLPPRVPGLGAGADAATAHAAAHASAEVILEQFDAIANDRDSILALAAITIDRNGGDPYWTVADVVARWPLEERGRTADALCPECNLRSVRISPPRRRGGPERYACLSDSCDWVATSDDDGGLWAGYFAEEPPEDVRAHDPRWLTLAEAARRAECTTGTIRRRARRGLIATDAGRYWAADVDASKPVTDTAPSTDVTTRRAPERWLTLAEAAALVGRSLRALQTWKRAGDIAVLAGRVRESEVIAVRDRKAAARSAGGSRSG
ncbi:hypothetical protein [Microbacterium karelineae]|uniref:hypothetical protein n=1 Tax=Microbacterium karelineae TaxID=2654283 RepID=UPI0012E9CAF2|nr:hypothetical protein [Microbacterium karelineae]